MKFRMLALTFFLIASATLQLPVTSRAQSTAEVVISSFHSDIALEEDGDVRVVERIDVLFNQERRGIIRSIPYQYESEDGDIYTEVTIDSISRDNQPEPFEVDEDDGFLHVRIGDASIYHSGTQNYTITYTATGVLRSHDEVDELYWNVTGNNWDMPITAASAIVTLPEPGIESTACYQGPEFSTTSCQIDQLSDTSIQFSATQALVAGDGLTLAVGFQPGTVPIVAVEPPPSEFELLWQQTTQPWGIGLALLAIIGGVGLPWWLWHRNGRDWWWQQPGILEENQRSWLKPWRQKPQVVVEFTPPLELRPAQVGKLIDQKADTLDITATIIDLASRKYLTIKELEKKGIFGSKDYELTRTEKSANKLLEYERLLLKKLFGGKTTVKISNLKNSFYQDLEKVKESLRADMMGRGYFVKSPKQVRETYLAIGLIGTFIGIGMVVGGIALIWYWLLAVGVFAAIAGIGITILSDAMPQRTAKGFEVYRRILGYELFISTAERHKQKFFEDNNIFTQALPYAMVFGLTDKFAKAMDKIGYDPPQPQWYTGTHAFNAVLFSQNLNSVSQAMSQSMASAPSSSGSSGGGFSGGGFGGGGGGSW